MAYCFDNLYYDELKRRPKKPISEYTDHYKIPSSHNKSQRVPKIPRAPLHLPKIEADKYRDKYGFTYTYRKN